MPVVYSLCITWRASMISRKLFASSFIISSILDIWIIASANPRTNNHSRLFNTNFLEQSYINDIWKKNTNSIINKNNITQQLDNTSNVFDLLKVILHAKTGLYCQFVPSEHLWYLEGVSTTPMQMTYVKQGSPQCN